MSATRNQRLGSNVGHNMIGTLDDEIIIMLAGGGGDGGGGDSPTFDVPVSASSTTPAHGSAFTLYGLPSIGGTSQTSATFTLSLSPSDTLSGLPTTTDSAGWSSTGWSLSGGAYTNTFTMASVAVSGWTIQVSATPDSTTPLTWGSSSASTASVTGTTHSISINPT